MLLRIVVTPVAKLGPQARATAPPAAPNWA